MPPRASEQHSLPPRKPKRTLRRGVPDTLSLHCSLPAAARRPFSLIVKRANYVPAPQFAE